jgi:PAS domain S-box-containing protein
MPVYHWLKKLNRSLLSPLVLPLAFFLLSLGVIFFLWNNARETRINNLEFETAVTAEQIKLRLEAWVDSRTAILQYMGSNWENLPQLGESRFTNDAQEIIDLYPGFQAINLIDEDWIIRVVVPEATNEAALNKDLHIHPDPAVGTALQEALDTISIRRSPMIHLLQGKPGFATYFPIFGSDGKRLGVLNGVFVMEQLVNSCLSEKRLKERFAITIKTLSGETAYSHTPQGFPENLPESLEGLNIRIVDKYWRLSLVPLASVSRPLLLTGEGVGLVGGTILALALSLLLRAYLFRVGELRVSRENYKLLVDNQADMVVKLDSEDRFLFVSPSTVKKIGVPEADILGHKTSEFVHPDDTHLLEALIQARKSGQDDLGNLVVRLKNFDGWVWTSWAGSAIRNAEGQVQALVIVGRDITQQREMESRLRQGQKMQAVGQLAGGVAHDFNNIIQAILGYLGFVKEGLPPDSESYQDLTQAEIAAERAAALTRQLLAFSRRQMLLPVLLDLNKVTSELLPMLRRLLGESIALNSHFGSDLSPVLADRSQIEQILVNLCINSRDAIAEETGVITIETSEISLDEDFCLTHQWAEPGQWIRLSLTDSGQGMNENTMAQIFEPFFTTKEMGKGSGLGLATVYGIVKQHEGLIDVESLPGQGTCFSLFFRAVDGQAPEDKSDKVHLAKPGVETILLAEDEEMVRNLTTRILEMAGYRVLVADNGRRAHKLWVEKNQEIDIVVMDMVMPQMGGRELSELILEDRPDARILFISGYDSESFRAPMDLDETKNILLKPFNRELLLNRVREILDR